LNAKNNRVNHLFQIVHFLVGSCHTADGAYSLLCDLREDRELALKNVASSILRCQAKRLRAEKMTRCWWSKAKRLDGRADLAEIDAFAEVGAKNVAAAESELADINWCIEQLQPLRKFADLPDHEAHEKCQDEEWLLELINRAENHILMHGSIPADEFNTMRMHPRYKDEIAPRLAAMDKASRSEEGRAHMFVALSKKDQGPASALIESDQSTRKLLN
jgi:hypothetical protein